MNFVEREIIMTYKRFFVLLIAFMLLLTSCGAPNASDSSAPSKEDGKTEQSKDVSVETSFDNGNGESSDSLFENSEDSEKPEDSEISSDEDSDDPSDVGDDPEKDDETVEPTVDPKPNGYKPLNYDFVKAVWLTQFDLFSVYRNGSAQRSRESFTELMTTVLDNLKKDGYNTVFVQVRPNADSYYPSEFYPISYYVSGAYGRENIYDPFEIVVDLAHERGLSVHAWLNPMRAMKTNQITSVPDKYYIKQWYDDEEKMGRYLVEIDGQLYLNPAHEAVRNLISCGAAEVCSKYNVDGVHIDDYFYPTTDSSFDSVSYSEYKSNGGTKSLAEFRYENIDLMVSSMYSAIKAVNEELLFGVSPEGNINNTYNHSYTDVYKWCSQSGYLDYICPQIYFGLEHQTHDFKKIFGVWNAIVKNENIRVFVGMTLEKADKGFDNYAGSGKTEWADNKNILQRCLEFLKTQPSCSGVSLFSYQFMYDALTGVPDAETRTERDNMKPALEALGK